VHQRERELVYLILVILDVAVLDGFMCVTNKCSQLDFEFKHYELHIGVFVYDESPNAFKVSSSSSSSSSSSYLFIYLFIYFYM
jgi:hypothetical protein